MNGNTLVYVLSRRIAKHSYMFSLDAEQGPTTEAATMREELARFDLIEQSTRTDESQKGGKSFGGNRERALNRRDEADAGTCSRC